MFRLLFAAFFLVCFFLVILIFIWRSKRRSLFQLFGLTISGPLCPVLREIISIG